MPLYYPEGTHPDGACFPGSEIKFAAFGKDGTAHTILGVETIDPAYGVWTVGAECTLVGLPSGPVEVAGSARGAVVVRDPNFSLTFIHPDTVRAGELYELDAHIHNTSLVAANLQQPQNLEGEIARRC